MCDLLPLTGRTPSTPWRLECSPTSARPGSPSSRLACPASRCWRLRVAVGRGGAAVLYSGGGAIVPMLAPLVAARAWPCCCARRRWGRVRAGGRALGCVAVLPRLPVVVVWSWLMRSSCGGFGGGLACRPRAWVLRVAVLRWVPAGGLATASLGLWIR